jgi:hypothetical protein
MDAGRKRVVGIIAGILMSRNLDRADDLFGGPQGSPRTDKMIGAAIPVGGATHAEDRHQLPSEIKPWAKRKVFLTGIWLYTLCHYTSLHMRRRPSSRKRLVNRAGIPFQVYFTPEQMSQMRRFSQERSLPLATIVRTAVDQLLRKWRNDDLTLPLGFEQ